MPYTPVPPPEVAEFLTRFADPIAALVAGHIPDAWDECGMCREPWPCTLMTWVDGAIDALPPDDIPEEIDPLWSATPIPLSTVRRGGVAPGTASLTS